MPGKSRHDKGKHPHHSKKSKAIQRQKAMAQQTQVTAATPSQVTTVNTPVTPAPVAAPAKIKTMQYPYIAGELRRIGILSGIILVILVVLAIVLS